MNNRNKLFSIVELQSPLNPNKETDANECKASWELQLSEITKLLLNPSANCDEQIVMMCSIDIIIAVDYHVTSVTFCQMPVQSFTKRLSPKPLPNTKSPGGYRTKPSAQILIN